eukprot:gene10403-10561_t
MISIAANWVELLTGLLLWKYPTLQPQLHLRQVAMKTRAAAGLSSTEHCDQDFLNFFDQLLLAASDQEVQSVISLCTSSDYCSQQFVAHIYDVLRGLAGADRVISRPLPALGGDQSELYTLAYAESLMVQACSWQLAAEYLAWCPVHGADALETLIETSPFPLQDDHAAHKALALADRHGLTSAAQGLCRRLGMAAAQTGRLAGALQWWVRAHDPARCADLVTPLVLKVQQQLLQQARSYQGLPLDVPELFDLEPLLLNLPSQSGLGELPTLLSHGHQQLQHHVGNGGRGAQSRPYQELHFLRAFLQLQQALQALHQCHQQQQGMQKQPSEAALTSVYASDGSNSSRLHVRHVDDVRLALCRGLARGHLAESTSNLMVKPKDGEDRFTRRFHICSMPATPAFLTNAVVLPGAKLLFTPFGLHMLVFGLHPLAPAQRRFTLEELRELYTVLVRNPVVNESNRALVVETIRSIAEFMIWGDQNEPRIFDFFLENNIMTYLQRVLQQPANRSGEVAKQVLQTLSIIIQNVRSETAVFFLFSNNHVNNIVDLDFDFDDEEVLGYYISFLKTISLKLNRGTAQFFINTGSGCRGFPLYTRAIRLAHNREGMVRAAVRTLTLHVFSVGDQDIQAFVTSAPASSYFSEVAMYLTEQIQLLDRRLCGAEAGGSQALGSLDSQLAEVEDVLSYISDLLSLGEAAAAAAAAGGVVGPGRHGLAVEAAAHSGTGSKASSGSINMLNLLTQQYLPNQLQDLVKRQSQPDAACAAANGPAAATSTASSSMHHRSRSIEDLESWLVQAEEGSVDASDAWALRPPVSFTATSSYVAPDQAVSVLSSDQQQLVQAALAAAQHAFSAHLVGMWCEAVFPMVTMEWQTAREQIQRPVLRAGGDALLTGPAVWPLLAGLQQQQGLGMASTAAGSAAGSKTAWDALSVSARAGLECYMAVQRVVALTQLQELLLSGGVSLSPPVPTVSEVDLKQVDVQEGYQVDLAPGPAAGIVLSVAPLLGAHPYTDQGVTKWLHVHVRPSVRGLLRVIKTAAAKKGGLLSAMRQLADGHWVLAFSAADKAAGAVHLVQQHTARLQALYRDALAPLDLEERSALLVNWPR